MNGSARRLIEQGLADGLHIGAQICAIQDGRTMTDFAVGEARRGVAMTPDTLMPWLSAGKPVAAVAIAQLWEREKLDLDDLVCRHIPEFGTKGKEAITIRHLLTHTGGFRLLGVKWHTEAWEEIIHRICDVKLDAGWISGKKGGYHVASSWYILGELVRRLDGRSYDRYIRDEIFLPLGLDDCWCGMPVEKYREYGDRIGLLHNTERGRAKPDAHAEVLATHCRPGAGCHGSMRGLARFYEMLHRHGELEEVRLLQPETVEALTARHRIGMVDMTFDHVLDWGLGFMIDSRMYGTPVVPYGFGAHCSSRTFGHGGQQSSMGFCDPEHKLVVAWVLNGQCGEARHLPRNHALNTAIYEDLGLVR